MAPGTRTRASDDELNPMRGLTFIEGRAEENRFTNQRNFLAVQSALHRGDTEVLLHNRSTFDPASYYKALNRWSEGPDPADSYTQFFRGDIPRGGAGGYMEDEDIESRVRALLNPEPPWEGFEIEDGQIIGVGGFGVVMKARVTYTNGIQRMVVFKISKTPGANDAEELAAEREFNERYRGAAHTVQLLDLVAEAEENQGNAFTQDETKAFDEAELGVLVLEYAPCKDLYHIVQLIVRHKLEIPDSVLWNFWLCCGYPVFVPLRSLFPTDVCYSRQNARFCQLPRICEAGRARLRDLVGNGGAKPQRDCRLHQEPCSEPSRSLRPLLDQRCVNVLIAGLLLRGTNLS